MEPLLESIKRDENMRGAYLRTKEELLGKVTIQVYADDVIFCSERENGITRIFQIMDQFVEWSRMEINVSRCATMSYISDENRRRTYPATISNPGEKRSRA
jgi:hypothetical protein